MVSISPRVQSLSVAMVLLLYKLDYSIELRAVIVESSADPVPFTGTRWSCFCGFPVCHSTVDGAPITG
jgi:hypothetical protein